MLLHYLLFCLLFIHPLNAFNEKIWNVKISTSNGLNTLPSNLLSQSAMLTHQPSRHLTHRTTSRQASDTSSDLGSIIISKTGGLRSAIISVLKTLRQSLPFLSSAQSATIDFVRRSWWIYPMFLAVVPLYCAFFKGTCATMPDWWQVVNMEYIRQSKDAAFVVGCFLFSNIAYFLSGTYLLQRFPFEKNGERKLPKPTRLSMLGIWMLASGLISTIFHSVQALGSYAVAGALCYVDHAFAISAGFYFFETCGRPSNRVLGMGMISLVALAATSPGYAWLHSTWHFLSAATATKWALEAHTRKTASRL